LTVNLVKPVGLIGPNVFRPSADHPDQPREVGLERSA